MKTLPYPQKKSVSLSHRIAAAFLALGVATATSTAGDFYVSATAGAESNGTKDAPFQNLTQARDAIRTARKAGKLAEKEPVTVHIAAGVYSQKAAFELKAEDSGSKESPVIFKAEKLGAVRFQGGITLKPETFAKVTDAKILDRLQASVRDKVVVCDLSKLLTEKIAGLKTSFRGAPSGPWLYVDGEPMTLSRWPNLGGENEGWATFSKAIDKGLPDPKSTDPEKRKHHPGSFEFDDDRPNRWHLDEGVWLLGYWTHDWNDEVIRIKSYDKENKAISLAASHSYGIMGGTWGGAKRRFFAMNSLDELDAPGEWYLDRDKKQLYFYPKNPIAKSAITLATLDQPLLKIDGAKHVKFVQLAFEYGVGEAISAKRVEHVEFLGCEVSNFSSSGMSVNGSNNVVRSCNVFNLGRSGITVTGGDRKTLTSANNVVKNNHIHHYGNFQRTYAPAIGVHGCGQIIQNNRIHDAPHNAITYSGNEHLFELNNVYRVVMETGDSGAFYTGRDWTSQGNILRHNFIHNLGGDSEHINTMGIYLDDCDSGDTLEGNVFYRAGRAMMIGGGRDNPILNNLVIDCPIGLHLDSRGMRWKQWNNPEYAGWNLEERAKKLNYQSPPWSTKYPTLAKIMDDSPQEPRYNPIRRNIFIDCAQKVGSFDTNVIKMLDTFEIADNLVVNTVGREKEDSSIKSVKGFTSISGTAAKPIVPGFKNPKEQDFALKAGSRLLKELPSFEEIPFDKIGLYADEFRTAESIKKK